jgi:N,N'-diacetyllegionaminate synthase
VSRTVIVGEAGVNHNGDVGRARELIAAAAAAGVDYVKFQAFRAADLVTQSAGTAPYQAHNTGTARQVELLSSLEISRDGFAELSAECRHHGVGFMCTPFSVADTRYLVSLGMDRIKVASGELTNTPALVEFAATRLPVLLSTGMATLDEVAAALATLKRHGSGPVTVLHCTSIYPAPVGDVNLRAMVTMRERLQVPVGYSDHTLDDHVSLAAVALGAVAIEKHFTLDRNLPGPDHRASLEPAELAHMVRRIRDLELALGDGVKQPSPAEIETARLVRRSWHAARDLAAGAVLAQGDLVLKRPADGLPPDAPPVGRRLKAAVVSDQALRPEHLA